MRRLCGEQWPSSASLGLWAHEKHAAVPLEGHRPGEVGDGGGQMPEFQARTCCSQPGSPQGPTRMTRVEASLDLRGENQVTATQQKRTPPRETTAGLPQAQGPGTLGTDRAAARSPFQEVSGEGVGPLSRRDAAGVAPGAVRVSQTQLSALLRALEVQLPMHKLCFSL